MIKPDDNVRFWCWAQVIGTAILAWCAATLIWLIQRGSLADSSPFLVPVLGVSVVFALFARWRCSRAVEHDPSLTEAERQRIRSWLRLFGPAGAVQLLLFIYFPSSRFAGH
jgi:hypothetical protein